MPSPVLLADNDILSLAAHWDLLDQIPALAGGAWTEVACISSLPFRARRYAAGGRDKLFYDPAAASRLVTVLAHAQAPPQPTVGSTALLADHVGIEPGEQLLLAAMLDDPALIFMTGDKRALRALPQCLAPADLMRLQGRVISTEGLIASGLAAHGIVELRRRMRPYVAIDTMARIVLGADCNRSEADVREGLASYVADLQKDCQGLLRE